MKVDRQSLIRSSLATTSHETAEDGAKHFISTMSAEGLQLVLSVLTKNLEWRMHNLHCRQSSISYGNLAFWEAGTRDIQGSAHPD